MTVACGVLSAGSVIAGYSVVLCMSPVARALIMALCLQVHTKSGKVRYKYSMVTFRSYQNIPLQRIYVADDFI